MNVLMISMDRSVLKPDAPVRRRLIEYGGLCESLHVIVFTKKTGIAGRQIEITNKVFIGSYLENIVS